MKKQTPPDDEQGETGLEISKTYHHPNLKSDLNLLLHLSYSQKIRRVCYSAAAVLIFGLKGLSHI
eukprot:scaffold48573_cov30-Cyclotella_meneghiniana.AAC.1